MSELERLANEYDAACAALEAAWPALIGAPLDSPQRATAAAVYRDALGRVVAARTALLAAANGGTAGA